MCWQPGHNTRPHAQLSARFLGMDAWMTSQLNVVLISTLLSHWFAWIIVWHVINMLLHNQALADVRSTGAGIKYLYCTHWPTLGEILKTMSFRLPTLVISALLCGEFSEQTLVRWPSEVIHRWHGCPMFLTPSLATHPDCNVDNSIRQLIWQ